MQDRVRPLNSAPIRSKENGASYVLYWTGANRRVEGNHALAHAATLANELKLPLLYYEPLTCAYPSANDRLHTFILEGVPDNAARLHSKGIGYCFHLRRRFSDPADTIFQLAAKAAAVISDDYPTFYPAYQNATVPPQLACTCYAVDSSCVIPMNRFEKRQYAAYTIRPRVQKLLPEYLKPVEVPHVHHRFTENISSWHLEVERKHIPAIVASCEIDHSVPPSISFTGGSEAAELHLKHFLHENLKRYPEGRNEPGQRATSNLSPYLHFGQIGALDVALAVREYAAEHELSSAEFIEELTVRRELAFNFLRFADQKNWLANLPDWAQATLRDHERDRRPVLYTYEQLEQGRTGDEIWNACQKELLLRGKIHGYYRMYWGKKVIEWTPTYEEALQTLIRFHDRFALDGRDPNTYTNILWLFGLHDRPWQERPVFGKTRYMTADGLRRKTDVASYLAEIGDLERTGKDPYRIEAKKTSKKS